MEEARKVLHLRTGLKSVTERIGAWLAREGAERIDCADAFDACVYALQNRGHDVAAVFVGTDWLAPDEYPVLHRLQETWPTAVTVVYGDGRAPYAVDPAARIYVCTTPRDLDQLLSERLEHVVERIRRMFPARQIGESRPRPRPAQAPRIPGDDKADPAHPPAGSHAAWRAAPPTDFARRDAETGPSERDPALAVGAEAPADAGRLGLFVPPEPPRSILSREELEALLKDTGV